MKIKTPTSTGPCYAQPLKFNEIEIFDWYVLCTIDTPRLCCCSLHLDLAMDSLSVERAGTAIVHRRLEAAVATMLKQLAERRSLLSAAVCIGLDPNQPPPLDSPVAVRLRQALPELVNKIEAGTDLSFDKVAPALVQSLSRAVELAAADRMPLEDTMAAMERLIRHDRVDLFTRGLL